MPEINSEFFNNHWHGVVVDINDPDQSGRVRVRIRGMWDNIALSKLPWVIVQQPVTSAAIGKMGTAPVGLIVGSNVIGIWLDGPSKQQPMVQGTWGKIGDVISGQFSNGAPAIDNTKGSIPPASSGGNAKNWRSGLNSSATPISLIDQGISSVISIGSDIGTVITSAIEKGMINAKVPTIAYESKYNKSDVMTLKSLNDPLARNASIPCLNLSFLSLKNLLELAAGILGNIAGALKNLLVQALTNAILELCRRFGVFKVLGLLNSAANAISEIANLLNALNIRVCGMNLFNQGIFDTINGVVAETLHAVNNITGAVSSAIGGIVNSASNLFDNIVTAPLASIATGSTPVPPTISINPPDGYVQQYNQNADPYPGYIVFLDPTGKGTASYIPRNGEPNYISSQQHIFFNAQKAFIANFESSIISGVLGPTGLVSGFTAVTSITQAFAATRILGVGFSIAAAGALAAVSLISYGKDYASVYTPQPRTIPASPLVDFSISKFSTTQMLLNMKKTQMNIGLGGLF
jgi:hypothetical protein